jgi:hypothetical protein
MFENAGTRRCSRGRVRAVGARSVASQCSQGPAAEEAQRSAGPQRRSQFGALLLRQSLVTAVYKRLGAVCARRRRRAPQQAPSCAFIFPATRFRAFSHSLSRAGASPRWSRGRTAKRSAAPGGAFGSSSGRPPASETSCRHCRHPLFHVSADGADLSLARPPTGPTSGRSWRIPAILQLRSVLVTHARVGPPSGRGHLPPGRRRCTTPRTKTAARASAAARLAATQWAGGQGSLTT